MHSFCSIAVKKGASLNYGWGYATHYPFISSSGTVFLDSPVYDTLTTFLFYNGTYHNVSTIPRPIEMKTNMSHISNRRYGVLTDKYFWVTSTDYKILYTFLINDQGTVESEPSVQRRYEQKVYLRGYSKAIGPLLQVGDEVETATYLLAPDTQTTFQPSKKMGNTEIIGAIQVKNDIVVTSRDTALELDVFDLDGE